MARYFAFAITLCILFSAAPLYGEELRVGVVTDLSAKMPTWGQQTVRGAELAGSDLSAAGPAVHVVVEDHAMSTAKAVSAVKKLLELDHVQALYIEFSLASMAVVPLVKSKGTLAIFNAPVRLTLTDDHHIFRSFTDFSRMCQVFAEAWRSRGFTKVAILRIPTESGDLCGDGARTVYPDLRMEQFNPGDDLAPYLLRFAAGGVQGVMNIGLEPDILSHLEQLRRLKLQMRLGAVANMFNDIAETRYSDVLSSADAFGYEGIDEQFQKRLSGAPRESLEAAAMAYTHVRQAGLALQKCGAQDAACQVQVLSASPPDNTIGFLGWKNNEAQYRYQLRSWRDGKKVPEQSP